MQVDGYQGVGVTLLPDQQQIALQLAGGIETIDQKQRGLRQLRLQQHMAGRVRVDHHHRKAAVRVAHMARQALWQVEDNPVEAVRQGSLALGPEFGLLDQQGIEGKHFAGLQLPIGQHAQAWFHHPGMFVPGLLVQGRPCPAFAGGKVHIEVQAQGVLRAHIHQQHFLPQRMQRMAQGRHRGAGAHATANTTQTHGDHGVCSGSLARSRGCLYCASR